ncbi:hypothetical protein INS49_000061 [Diaporthe citri]|uniref:uncharacterized protein n=1 Tax=Diaporthe citri TaxID=83186 RepID=UPI001C81E86D|nr:uncharacterized protein INS49_000061 [Diaporthe citri]KAG6365885.1 hypothetical protein INS49_000061 [Diaporthe citri]
MPRKSAAAAKVDLIPGGQPSVPRQGVSQPVPGVTRRVTRSTCKPGDLLDPGGPGSFSGKSQGSRPTVKTRAEARVQTAPFATGLEQDHSVLPTVETAEARSRTSELTRGPTETDSTEDSNFDAEDDLETFYKRIGYLPPLDDATIEVLEFLSLSVPDMDTDAGRVSASKQPKVFRTGLEEYRNVDTRPTEPRRDPLEQKIKGLVTATEEENQDVTAYRNRLWTHDLEKCSDEFSEKIFQRTILMAMIDRCRLIYESELLPISAENSANKPLLDFAVESIWNCPPMPTEAAKKSEKLLTRPMPDLAIAFRRETLFTSDHSWKVFPSATRKIMCYEGIGGEDTYRAFHFLTIEAKRAYTGVDDKVAIYQSLNNASQALHNMYEFFREADMGIDERGNDIENGDKYRNIFFDEVRFFSVVATAGAMKIRIHRACHQDPDMVPIVEGYPLEFKFADYTTIGGGGEFARQKVVEELAKILLGYGVGQLGVRLQEAIKEVEGKFQTHRRNCEADFPRRDDFYSHGLYERLVHLAQTNKQKRATASARTTGSQTPRNTARNGQQPASQSQSLSASQLRISVSSDATSSGQVATSESATPAREGAASEQGDSDAGRGRRKKRKKPIG